MQYKKFEETYYIRFDKGEEIVDGIKQLCKKEHIASATYYGIGGCSHAEIQTFVPEQGSFVSRHLEGLLELTSFMGNIISKPDGTLCEHTHAMFAYLENGEHRTAGGHLKATTVRYTAEIELRLVRGGTIGYAYDAETGTGFWEL